MKKNLLILFTCLICTSVFAQVKQIDSTELVKILEKNTIKEIIFVSEINLDNIIWDYEGNFLIPSVDSKKYDLVAEIEIDFLRERLNYKNLSKYKVSFQLKSKKPKIYAIKAIDGIETVSECKARIEEEERIAEEARLEEERIAEEKRLEEERIAEEARLEEERIAEEKRLEEERIAEEKRLEKQRNAKFLPIYEAHLSKAKKYESEKRWCYALGSYYDAMGTAGLDPEYKTEAVKGYNLLSEAIRSGNPGHGNYNPFTIHDEWKKLLIDAEKYGCSFNPYEVTVGDLVQGDLDYDTKTASYSAEVSYNIGARYMYTIEIIEAGYKIAYKNDWNDLPKEWPKYSASYKEDNIYNINGAYVFSTTQTNIVNQVYTENYNAFGINDNCEYSIWVKLPFSSRYESSFYRRFYTLIDCKFNIIDENGKELVKPVRCLLGQQPKVLFSGITPEIMNLIDNGKAFINPVGCYLQYGKYDSKLDNGEERSFIKNLPEVQLNMDKSVFIYLNNKTDKIYENVLSAISQVQPEMIILPESSIEFGKTEVTQELYVSVMGENPSEFKGANNPVERVSWYDAIYFCNKLSVAKGCEPVYSVDGNTDITKWNYKPHQGNSISGEITQNTSANGYRLPTVEEWQYAAKGGQDYTYAGSNEIDEVAWYDKNSNDKTHPVAQKKANGYGLYDMSGNVSEWCWDSYAYSDRYYCGGSGSGYSSNCMVISSHGTDADNQYKSIGFRIIRSVK